MAPRLPTSTIPEEDHDAETEAEVKEEKSDVEDEKQNSDDQNKEEQNDIKKSEKITFESLVSQQLGEFGRYQMLQFFLLCLPSIFVAMHVMSWTFVAAPPQFNGVLQTNNTNSTDAVGLMEETVEMEVFQGSATKRWNIEGDRVWIKATVQSLYYIGQMVGSLYCGIAADKIGRKKVFYLALVIQCTCGLLLTVAPTWWIFAILKAGTGISQPGLYGIAVVLGMELMGKRYRSLGAVVANIFYTFGQLILALLAYLIPDYRLLHFAIAAPSLLFLSYWWLIGESSLWLVSKGKYEEADVILNRAARVNKSYIPEKWWNQIEGPPATKKNTSFGITDLVRTPHLRKRSLSCFFIWPVTTMMYYGLTMKADLGGGNLYVNFAISAAMEIPALLIVYLLIDRIGRRLLVSSSLFIGGISLLSTIAVKEYAPSQLLEITVTMTSKAMITVAYTTMYTFTSELFPTVLRNTAVGCCSTIARIGAIASSYVALWLVDAFGPLTLVLPFACLAATAAVIALAFLPETMGKHLPESISEVEGNHI